jgi:hypothetical protein
MSGADRIDRPPQTRLPRAASRTGSFGPFFAGARFQLLLFMHDGASLHSLKFVPELKQALAGGKRNLKRAFASNGCGRTAGEKADNKAD